MNTPQFNLESVPDRASGPAVAIAAAGAKATAEIQAAMVIAKKYPRDENIAFAKVMRACKRPTLADMATYEYSRGGSAITGPSIHLAKVIAQAWGNIQFGWAEVERREGVSTCQAFAWDIETNTYNAISYDVKHWRDTKQGGYALKDERDIYELCANQSARRMRACLLSVVPGDLVDAALIECEATLKAGAGSEPIQDRARKMAVAFEQFGVSVEMLEARLGHKLSALNEPELAKLKKVYTSLRDGVGAREDFFTVEAAASPKFGKEQQPAPQSGTNVASGPQAPANPPAEPPPGGWPPAETPPAAAQAPAPGAPPAEAPKRRTRKPAADPAPAPASTSINYPKAMKGLLDQAQINVDDFIQWMVEANGMDDSITTLDEMALLVPSKLSAMVDDWANQQVNLGEWLATLS